MPQARQAELLRWIGVLPAAILGGIVVRFVCTLLAVLVTKIVRAGPESNLMLLAQVIVYALAAAAFVLAGAITAPRSRLFVALALAVAYAILSLSTHVLSQSNRGFVNYVHLTAEIAGALIGVACVLYVRKKVTPRAEPSSKIA